MGQIGKAATILDLKGDFPRAIEILESIVNHDEIIAFLPIKIEALAFLADIHSHLEKYEKAEQYISIIDKIDLENIEPDLIHHSLLQLERIRQEIEERRP